MKQEGGINVELIFRIGHSTKSADECPSGTFITKDNVKDDGVIIRKNSKRVQIPMGEESIEMWEYEEWRGTIQDYMVYSNDLFNLPSNQLQIIEFEDCQSHEDVEVELKDNVWVITLYRNELIEDEKYSYQKLTFERPIKNQSITAEMIKLEYTQYKDAMFDFCEYPESPIQANRTSAVALMDMIINLKVALDSANSEITTMKDKIEVLEGGN